MSAARSGGSERWKGLAAAFAAFALALGLAEAFVRLRLPEAAVLPDEAPAPTRFVPDDMLKFRLERNGRWTQRGERGEFAVGYETSAEGFRCDGRADDDSEGTTEVIVLGNSFVEGWGVPFPAAFIKVAERALREGGQAVRLENYGMSGYSTPQSYLLLKTLLPRKPGAVVFVFTPGHLHDDRDFLLTAALDGDGLATGVDIQLMVQVAAPVEPSYLRWATTLKPFLRRSALYRLVYHSLYNRAQVARIRPGDPASDRFFFTRPGVDYEPSLRTTLRYIQAMRDLSRGVGADFMVLIIPYGHQVGVHEWKGGRRRERLETDRLYPDEPLHDLERRLQTLDIPVLNVSPFLREASRPDRPLYFDLDVHLNEAGNEQVGRRLSDWLRQRLAGGVGRARQEGAPPSRPVTTTRP